jgi:hypothetical protein
MKTVAFPALLLPALSLAGSPFAGTWVMQPELTTFGDRPVEMMLERGGYRRTGCGTPIEVSTDGADHPVKDQPLFDAMSVRLANARRVDIVQKLTGKITWKGTYTVSKDQRTMTLEFTDESPATPVTGKLRYSRVGNPLSAAHALSGTWRPEEFTQLSASGSTMTIADEEHGLAVRWSDGRTAETNLDAKYHPLSGYLPGAQVSILNPRPDTLAINREQGVVPVEVSRAVLSEDGQTITYKQVDWTCHALTTYTYHKQPAP